MDFTKIELEQLHEEYYRLEHPSGLTVKKKKKKDFGSVFAKIGTRFGSIYSHFLHNGKEVRVPDGTAHYLEHKLFESEDGDAFSKYAKTGASANAYTSFDSTAYLFSCTERFEESLKILIDLIQSPYFTPETVAKEQGIIGQEIKMYEDSPDWRVLMNLLQSMYHQHPIRIDIAGSVDTIAEITPEILYECYHSYYNLHNMVLTVVGKVEPQQVLSILNETLRNDEPVQTELLLPEEPETIVTPYVEQILPVTLPLFEIGFKHACPAPRTSAEMLAGELLLDCFCGRSSALYRRLHDEKLANATLSSEQMTGIGYHCVLLGGESRDPKAAYELISEALLELRRTGVQQEDFERARRAGYRSMVGTLDNKQSLSSELMTGEFTGREFFDAFRVLQELKLSDVNDLLERSLDPTKCVLSVIRGE